MTGAVVAPAVIVWLPWPTRASSITRENAAKLARGMTPGEVEAILDGPARDEGTRRTLVRYPREIESLKGWDQRE